MYPPAAPPTSSGGDVGIQVCSDDAQVAYHAMHQLIRAAHGLAHPRWAQAGFTSAPKAGATPRNPLGFKDGTRNLDTRSAAVRAADLWCSDGPGWMRGGTYAVVRRIRTLLDTWDPLAVADQERIIGRTKAEGAPLGGRHEHDAPDFATQGADGPVIPASAHIRLAAPEANGGRSLLRRSYNYDDGVDPHTGQLDTGLLFIAYQRDPSSQFVPIQRRLAIDDALSEHLLHTGSAVFACPPGAMVGGTIGAGLVT